MKFILKSPAKLRDLLSPGPSCYTKSPLSSPCFVIQLHYPRHQMASASLPFCLLGLLWVVHGFHVPPAALPSLAFSLFSQRFAELLAPLPSGPGPLTSLCFHLSSKGQVPFSSCTRCMKLKQISA